MTNQTFADLHDGAARGYGADFTRFGKDAGANAAVLEMQKNLYRFSLAKTIVELEEINKALYDGDQVRQFSDFKKEVEKINSKYNRSYLETEFNTARNAAEHARKWHEYQKDADLFPNLKYMTVGDDRVREEHAALQGTVKPLGDPFWDMYYPPNGFNCRCYVVQSAEKAHVGKIEDSTVPKAFEGNVGKTGIIFSKNQSFFQIAKELGTAQTEKSFELGKIDVPMTVRYTAKNGGRVRVNPFTDTRPDELSGNYKVAVALADKKGYNVDLRAHLDGRIIKNEKNPEYLINGKKADRKTPESGNYKNVLKSASAQDCEIVIIDLSKNKDTIENAEAKLNNILKQKDVHKNIIEVHIVSADRKTIKTIKRKKQS